MKRYQPTHFHSRHNISPHKPLPTVLKLLGGLIAIVGILYVVLGATVDLIAENISPQQEQWLWSHLKKKLVTDKQHFLNKKRIQGNVRRIFGKIPKHSLKVQYPFQVIVQKSDSLNAFALPGGYIVITTALLNFVKSENTLVFVLSHELGHFQNRDHLKKLGRYLVLTKILKFLLGKDISGAFAQLMIAFDNQYSRGQEYAADQWGLALLMETYSHAGGATDFFKSLAIAKNRGAIQSFFSTHPDPNARIKRLQDNIKKYNMPIHDVIPWQIKLG